jgi:hypothetical protein
MDIDKLRSLGMAIDICPNGHKWNSYDYSVRQTLEHVQIYCLHCGKQGINILGDVYAQKFMINKSKNHKWERFNLYREQYMCSICKMYGKAFHRNDNEFFTDNKTVICEFPYTCNEYIIKNVL